jgi:glucose/arabinose dehydrogenase
VAGRPCDARRLPDGHTLVAAHRANRIIELDALGAEVWSVEGIEDPQTAQRLPGGNTLVAMSGPGVIREIDRDGRTIWERQGFNTPVDVQRLPDGTTLVQEQGGDLIELDATGTEVGRRRTGGNRFLRW